MSNLSMSECQTTNISTWRSVQFSATIASPFQVGEVSHSLAPQLLPVCQVLWTQGTGDCATTILLLYHSSQWAFLWCSSEFRFSHCFLWTKFTQVLHLPSLTSTEESELEHGLIFYTLSSPGSEGNVSTCIQSLTENPEKTMYQESLRWVSLQMPSGSF